MKKGFTLIELLIVIAIIATIIAFAVPNFLGARQRANDTRKKAEMIQLKNALRIYYNDYATYPENYNGGSGKVNYIKGCGSVAAGCAGDGECNCPCSTSIDFAAGGTGCDVIYMKKFPSDLGFLTMSYYQASSGDDFCLKVTLDNASDPEILKSQAKCGATISGAPCYQRAGGNDFAVCAD